VNADTYTSIQEAIKCAMRDGDSVKRDCLRSVVSDIKNQTVNAGRELTEDIVVRCIQKAVKQHKDSIEQFQNAGRRELAEKEIVETKHLQQFLPKTMSEQETREAVDLILNTVEAVKKNMGLIIKQLPKEADRKVAAQYLNSILK